MQIDYSAVWLLFYCLTLGGVAGLAEQQSAKDDLQHRIAFYEAALSKAQSSGGTALEEGRIRVRLGAWYQDAGMYDRSRDEFEKAIRSFKTPPVSTRELASAIDELGNLDLDTGDIADARRAAFEALALRQQLGEKRELAHSWYRLAVLSLRQREAPEAREYAQRAAAELVPDANAAPEDKVNALYALSLALGLSHQYEEAVHRVEDALRIEKASYGPDSFASGFGTFLLGYAHWKAGDLEPAGQLMRQGSETMGGQLGWWSPAYRSVMTQYARFLRITHRKREAIPIERSVRRALSEPGAVPHPRETVDVTAFF